MIETVSERTSPGLEKYRKEREEILDKLDDALQEQKQIDHKLQRAENRMEYLKKGERAKRTHRLCVKGAVIESLVSDLTDFTEAEFYDLMEKVFSLPQVREIVESEINLRNERKEGPIG